jgi:dGTPase
VGETVEGYGVRDRQRLVPESPKDVDADRGPFERDRARVLHSAGFRRLAAKTQVFGAEEDDFPRTRLTHSLEVAQIARELGAWLGCDPDVVDTAGLAHDLGHPPFGHNGEAALDEVAAAIGGFEGNAQTLRLLTRLESKVLHPDGTSAGLNLTRASLDACSKYPWPRRDGERKFGVYTDDLAVFSWLREDAPADRICLEAQVMDWADDVAYSVHDLEDGVVAGHIQLAALDDDDERAAVCATTSVLYSTEPLDELAAVMDRLLALPIMAAVRRYDGSRRAQVGLKWATSALTGRFTTAAVTATREAAGGWRTLSRYAADLVVPRPVRMEVALLKGLAAHYVMSRRGMGAEYAGQRELLAELCGLLANAAPTGLDLVSAADWADAPNDAARLRVIIDHVAGLTDRSARELYAKL